MAKTDAAELLRPRQRMWVIAAALMALFLGAMDALIMSAAMPTIVAELSGMRLYSWVYSGYFLARAVSLPIFGKLADLYRTRNLFLTCISIFIGASIAAGTSENMVFLIVARAVQGVGAGGNFALVYIVLADVSARGNRGRTLSLASSIWGIASVLGPTLGGWIVTVLSWRWIFFINVPLGLLSLVGISVHLAEMRPKRQKVHLDLLGVGSLSITVLAVLTVFLVGGREVAWASPEMAGLVAAGTIALWTFVRVERRAPDPILSPDFFGIRAFAVGNGSVFLSSFTIFSLFAFAPLFIQGALGLPPVQVGTAMLSLSLGWSAGSLALGQVIHRMGRKAAAVAGAASLTAGSAATVTFTTATTMTVCFFAFLTVGVGMGLVTLATLLVVQDSLDSSDLGVATSAHQFARTLGGTVGVGVCGGWVTARLTAAVKRLDTAGGLPPETLSSIRQGLESLFQPETQAGLDASVRQALQEAVVRGVSSVFWIVLAASVACLICCLALPRDPRGKDRRR
ncbi:MAG: MFS transporter [Desulfobacteraceae bacterium]|nr:MFS transporter [Desulfobacteraceae bacterium]